MNVFDYAAGPDRTWAIHTSVTHENRVGDRVLELLDTPVTDTSVWGTLPSGITSSPSIPFPTYGSLRPGPAFASPLGVTHVQPGGTFTVTVLATDGFVPTSVHVQAPWDLQTASSPPYTVTLNVPPDAIGPAVVRAFAFDADWNLAEAADINIVVDVLAPINDVTMTPHPLVLYTRAVGSGHGHRSLRRRRRSRHHVEHPRNDPLERRFVNRRRRREWRRHGDRRRRHGHLCAKRDRERVGGLSARAGFRRGDEDRRILQRGVLDGGR